MAMHHVKQYSVVVSLNSHVLAPLVLSDSSGDDDVDVGVDGEEVVVRIDKIDLPADGASSNAFALREQTEFDCTHMHAGI